MALNPNLINFENYRDNWIDLLENKGDYFIFVRALTEKNYDIFKSIINPKNLKRSWKATFKTIFNNVPVMRRCLKKLQANQLTESLW
jgi:hypothetical protein